MRNWLIAIVVFCCGAVLPSPAQSLSIYPSVTVETEATPGFLYDFQISSNLSEWRSLGIFKGEGRTSERTFRTDGRAFFRLQSTDYPKLSTFELLPGTARVIPPFSPSNFHYYFRTDSQSVDLNVSFNAAMMSEAKVNGLALVNGLNRISLFNSNRVLIDLKGTNGLVTRYGFEVLPLRFPQILVSNTPASDPNSIILMAIKPPSPGWFIAAVDHLGVPLWWKQFQLAHNLKLHDNGLLSVTAHAGTNSMGEQISKNVVLDQYFNELFDLLPVGVDLLNDSHDFVMTSRGTYFALAYKRNFRDLSDSSGSTNYVFKDGIVQEISLPGRQLLFEWNTWGHLDYRNMKYPVPDDYAHLNWIREDSDGHLLVSARSQSQIVKVNRQSGAVIWKLGRQGNFTFVNDPLNGFGGQHSVYRLANGNILLFDNRTFISTNAVVPGEGPSRVVEYRLNESDMTATLVWSYSRPGFHTSSAGGVQRMENGNSFVSWGQGPPSFATEVDPSGNMVQDIRIVDDTNRPQNGYIAYKIPRSRIAGAEARYRQFGPQ